MSKTRRLLLALVVGAVVTGCGVLPSSLLGGEVIVMKVDNQSGRPATLVVARSADVGNVVGSVDPAIVPAGQTLMVRFVVPAHDQWAIWANGGELMGVGDVKEHRGNIPMGIVIGRDGSPSWWCNEDCP